MSEKPTSVEVSMTEGSDEVMFTLVYADGSRSSYWRPFWRALWHCVQLIWNGVRVVDRIDA